MGIDNFLDGAGKALEIAPDLYDDVIKDAAQGTGKTFGLVPRTINAALVPLRIWIEKQEYNLEETKKLLAIKLENVDPEKIVTPEPYVAIPALQAIAYCMDSEALRNLYANLLSKSMNVDTKDTVHPSFAFIIQQLSAIDDRVLKMIPDRQSLPITIINHAKEDQVFIRYIIGEHATESEYSLEQDMALITLQRLGLIEIGIIKNDINSEMMKNMSKQFHNYDGPLEIFMNYNISDDNSPKEYIRRIASFARLTSLGLRFKEICID